MGDTKIEWTDKVWNAIRGCSRVSEGCRNCYAEGVAYRFSGPGGPYEGLVRIGSDGLRRREWNGQIKFVEKHLLDPLKWKEPKRIFVNSMSDLFHENVTDEMRDQIFAVMALCTQHTFQVLTKRPERMGQYVATRGRVFAVWMRMGGDWPLRDGCEEPVWPLPNVHLGVSCEDQATADKRIPLLLETPAAVRFISAEPLLGEICLKRIQMPDVLFGWIDQNALTGDYFRHARLVGFNGPRINWVIAGGESGPGARPMYPDWARWLRDECEESGTPFFFKQWGEYVSVSEVEGPGAHYHFPDGATVRRVGTKAAGAMLDGREWHEFPTKER